jgi:hypothetical protein
LDAFLRERAAQKDRNCLDEARQIGIEREASLKRAGVTMKRLHRVVFTLENGVDSRQSCIEELLDRKLCDEERDVLSGDSDEVQNRKVWLSGPFNSVRTP